MPRLDRSVLAPAALFALLAVAAAHAATRVFRQQEAQRFDVRYLPTSRALRFFSRPLQLSIANYYWLQTVQYIGEQSMSRTRSWEKVLPLVDLVTDLDPDHGYAYQTAGLVLSSAERLDESDAILRKGIERGPNWWSYPFYLAFNDFYYRGDYASAARWAERAARTPGASPNIARLAVGLSVKSGSPEDALRFIEEMRASVDDERLRETLDEQHRFAVLQRDFSVLDGAVERFRAARGRDPAALGELVAGGFIERVPAEPYGGAYVWREGAVHSTGRDHRHPAAEPGKLRPAASRETR